jgi:ribonuclease PH
MRKDGQIKKIPISDTLAAISVGVVQNEELLDLSYAEDSEAMVDMNVIMTASGRLVEIQGTAERQPFSRSRLVRLLDLAEKGVQELSAKVKELMSDVL